jgi:telomerase reverse transcriptase
VEYATPSSDVSAFCRAVLARLIPHGFWGVGKEGEENQHVIMRHVDRFIRLRKFENLSLHLVSQSLKVPLTRSILDAPAHVPYS